MEPRDSQVLSVEMTELLARTSYDLPTDPSLEDFRIVFTDLKWQLDYQITKGTHLAAKRPLTYQEWLELFWATQRFCENWNQNRAVSLYWRAVVVAGIESLALLKDCFGDQEVVWFEDLFKKLCYESSHRFSGWIPGLLIKMMDSVVVPVNKRWREAVGHDLDKYWMVGEVAAARFATSQAAEHYVKVILKKVGDARY